MKTINQPGLAAEPAAVDRQIDAVDVIGSAGCQKDGRAGQVVRQAPAAGRDAFQDLAAANRIIHQGFVHVGIDITWRDAIDVNAQRRPFIGQRFGELGDGSFAARISRDFQTALERRQRSDVYNLAAALGDHQAADCLAQEEYRLGIDIHDVIPVIFGERRTGMPQLRSCIVDQYVDPGKVDRDLVHEALQIVAVTEVISVGQTSDARLPDLPDCIQLRVGTDNRDVGAGIGVSQGYTLTDSLAAAGDQSNLSADIE